jgi:hypothetical protein
MDRIATLLASPAATAVLVVAALWPPATGVPVWPFLARGRGAGPGLPSLAISLFAFAFVRRLAALAQP